MIRLIIQQESIALRILLIKLLKQNLTLKPVITVINRYNLGHKLRIDTPSERIKEQDYRDKEKTKINGLSITKNKYFRKIKSEKQSNFQ